MPGMEDATVLTMLDYMEWRNREGNVLLRLRAVKEGGSEAPNQYLQDVYKRQRLMYLLTLVNTL